MKVKWKQSLKSCSGNEIAKKDAHKIQVKLLKTLPKELVSQSRSRL